MLHLKPDPLSVRNIRDGDEIGVEHIAQPLW